MSRVNIAGYNVSANPTAPNSLFDNGGGGGSFDPSDYLSNITITESGATVTFTGIDGDGGSRVLGTITIPDGSDGITFTPHITQITGGYRLSWTNDGGAENPDPVDILNGAAGAKGDKGDTGDNGTTFTPSITEITGGYRLSWTNDGGKANPNPVDILDGADGATGPQGPAGAAGPGVAPGGTTGQVLTKSSNDNYDTEWSTPSGGSGDIEEFTPSSEVEAKDTCFLLIYFSGDLTYATVTRHQMDFSFSGATVSITNNDVSADISVPLSGRTILAVPMVSSTTVTAVGFLPILQNSYRWLVKCLFTVSLSGNVTGIQILPQLYSGMPGTAKRLCMLDSVASLNGASNGAAKFFRISQSGVSNLTANIARYKMLLSRAELMSDVTGGDETI